VPHYYFKNARRDLSNATLIRGILPDQFLNELQFNRAAIAKGKEEQRKKMRVYFIEFLKLVIDDCITRNIRFYSPTLKRVEIFLTEKPPQEVVNKIKKGLYNDVDLIQSDGKVYHLHFFSHFVGPRPFRRCRISYKKYKEVVARVNKGMRYYERNQKAPEDKITRMMDYMPQMREMFPEMDHRVMRKIIIRGFYRIHREMLANREIYIKSAARNFHLIISNLYEEKVQERV
jgi:hypothetical protein